MKSLSKNLSGFKLFQLKFYLLGFIVFFAPAVINAEPEFVPAFWLDSPMRFPEGSTQYFNIPLLGGSELGNVKDFKIILSMPEDFELEKDLCLPVWSCFGYMMFAYPDRVTEEKGENGNRNYVLSFDGLGTTGVQVMLSMPHEGRYQEVKTVVGSDGWKEYSRELKISERVSPACASLWILRWSNREGQKIGKNILKCRGIVDVDNIVVRDSDTNDIIYQENFDGAELNGVEFRNSIWEKEDGNGFVRIKTTDENTEKQQSAILSMPATLQPGKSYRITFKGRAQIDKTPSGYMSSPVFIKLNKTDLKQAEISCRFSYSIDGKTIETKTEKLPLVIDRSNSSPSPSELEVALWSDAEDAMGGLPEKVQDIILKITKDSGVKMHFTTLHMNPWMPKCGGDVSKMNLRDPLSLKIKSLGMKTAPYISCGFYDWDPAFFNEILAYLKDYPEEAAINAFGNKITRGGHGLRSELPALCPTRLLSGKSKFWDVFLDFIHKASVENKWDGLMWDFEVSNILGMPYPVKTEKMGCFCEECVTKFKEKFRIKDLNVAQEGRPQWPSFFPLDNLSETARVIIKNYYLEWMKFRAGQNAEMWDSMIKAVRKNNKDAKFYLYSGSMKQMPSYGAKTAPPFHHCEYYGVNLPEAGKYIDVFMDIHYPLQGLRGLREIQIARQAARSSGRPVKVLNTVFPLKLRNKLAKNLCINAVAYTMADGIQIYSWSGSFDSQTWFLISEGLRALSDFEEFFLKGIRMNNLAKLDKNLSYSLWLKGQDRVLFVMNDSSEGKTVNVKNHFSLENSGLRWKASNYFSGEEYSDPSNISLRIPAYDTGVVSFKAY
jgi:hypothetical protein